MPAHAKALTPEQVFLCADQLVQEGKHPTIASLRERLGSGSVTTIHKYLTQWKTQKQQKPATPAPSSSDYPTILRAVQSEIDRAVAQALPPLQEEILSLKNEAAEWTREIERLESERETLEEHLAQMTSERNSLEGRLIGRTEELVREMDRLRQELEKERQEKAEAREKAAELWGRLTQIQETGRLVIPSPENETRENGQDRRQKKEKA